MMSALGPRARALVDAGRGALRPAAGERERVEAALRARLGAAALPPQGSVAPSAPPPAPAVAVAGWQIGLGAVVGAGLIGAALYLGFAPAHTEAPKPVERASSSAASASPKPEPALPSPPAPLPPAAPAPNSAPPPGATARATPAHAPDRLAEEVALLSLATTALRQGRPAAALKALDEHQTKFPHGTLSEERRAAKAQALCSLGRFDEGRAALRLLPAQSPAAARVKQACGAEASHER